MTVQPHNPDQPYATGGIVDPGLKLWIGQDDRVCYPPFSRVVEESTWLIDMPAAPPKLSADDIVAQVRALYADIPPPPFPDGVRLNPAEIAKLPRHERPLPWQSLDALLGVPVIPDEGVSLGSSRPGRGPDPHWTLTGPHLSPEASSGDNPRADHDKGEPNLPWPCGVVVAVIALLAILGAACAITVLAMLGVFS